MNLRFSLNIDYRLAGTCQVLNSQINDRKMWDRKKRQIEVVWDAKKREPQPVIWRGSPVFELTLRLIFLSPIFLSFHILIREPAINFFLWVGHTVNFRVRIDEEVERRSLLPRLEV